MAPFASADKFIGPRWPTGQGEFMRVEIIQGWGDNYTYIVISGRNAFVVDPPDAGPVKAKLNDLNVGLKQILVTHHHADHTGGCRELKEITGCEVIGPPGGMGLIDHAVKGRACSPSAPDYGRLGEPSLPLEDNFELNLNGLKVYVLSVPGHTSSDVAYWLPDKKAVFTGDTLFAGGCGRVFGGDYEMMWRSLTRLRSLPDETQVYCGHEYTMGNLQFALQLEPGNKDIAERLKTEQAKLNRGEPSVPSTIGLEKATNPFFRADTEEVRSAVHSLEAQPDVRNGGESAWETFRLVRQMKDSF